MANDSFTYFLNRCLFYAFYTRFARVKHVKRPQIMIEKTKKKHTKRNVAKNGGFIGIAFGTLENATMLCCVIRLKPVEPTGTGLICRLQMRVLHAYRFRLVELFSSEGIFSAVSRHQLFEHILNQSL